MLCNQLDQEYYFDRSGGLKNARPPDHRSCTQTVFQALDKCLELSFRIQFLAGTSFSNGHLSADPHPFKGARASESYTS